jgi:hypothetical protein
VLLTYKRILERRVLKRKLIFKVEPRRNVFYFAAPELIITPVRILRGKNSTELRIRNMKKKKIKQVVRKKMKEQTEDGDEVEVM